MGGASTGRRAWHVGAAGVAPRSSAAGAIDPRPSPPRPSLAGWFVQSIDLSERSEALASVDPAGAIFLGCRFEPETETSLRDRGALVFPQLPDLPFDPYRPHLYTGEELYDAMLAGGTYAGCSDARIYAWVEAAGPRPDIELSLATSLHDYSISDALDERLDDFPPERIVGLMGGHAHHRSTPEYRSAARLAAALTSDGWTVMTGGGPGAMEAANLGAWFAGEPASLRPALDLLAAVPEFQPDTTAWARTAFEVRRRWPASGSSLGVPTWYYGHEPPNAFADRIAKYFSNAIREDTLLHHCRGGIVFLPGAAGTVQEIFQASTSGYYASDPASITPMVLVGGDYWRSVLPAWPLLHRLAADRPLADKIHLVETMADAVGVLAG